MDKFFLTQKLSCEVNFRDENVRSVIEDSAVRRSTFEWEKGLQICKFVHEIDGKCVNARRAVSTLMNVSSERKVH